MAGNMRLQGKRALILGTDAIASGIAARFADEGATVTLIDTSDAFDRLEEIGTVITIGGDPPAASVARALVGRPLDILVVGGGDVMAPEQWKAIDEVDAAELCDVMERQAATALEVVKAAGGALKENGGSVIFLFNPAGLYSEGGWGANAMVHHAKRGLARALASEWGRHQIRVNSLVPLADTPGFQAYRERNPQQVDWRVSKTAIGRMGDPVRDIGGAAVFLASDDTRYLTGSMVFADGGAFLGLPIIDSTLEAA